MTVSAGIGIGLVALFAASGDASGWICSLDVCCAALALIAAALLRASSMLGLGLLPPLSVGLTILFFTCRAFDAPAWLAGAQLAFAVVAWSLAVAGTWPRGA